MTDLENTKSMLARAGASFDEEKLDGEGVIEIRAPSEYDDAKCEIVFIFDGESGVLRRFLIMEATP
jgi:hypothetical protein